MIGNKLHLSSGGFSMNFLPHRGRLKKRPPPFIKSKIFGGNTGLPVLIRHTRWEFWHFASGESSFCFGTQVFPVGTVPPMKNDDFAPHVPQTEIQRSGIWNIAILSPSHTGSRIRGFVAPFRTKELCQWWFQSHRGHLARRRKRKGTGRSQLRETACDVRGPDFGYITSRSLPLQDDRCSFATIVAGHAILSVGVRGLSFAWWSPRLFPPATGQGSQDWWSKFSRRLGLAPMGMLMVRHPQEGCSSISSSSWFLPPNWWYRCSRTTTWRFHSTVVSWSETFF